MSEIELIPLTEIARRLGGVSLWTVKRRIREAGIDAPRPGRDMMLTEDDYRQLVNHIRTRKHSSGERLTLEAKSALRKMRTRETKRLAAKIEGPVVALNLERPKR